jgi:hypothetical protein
MRRQSIDSCFLGELPNYVSYDLLCYGFAPGPPCFIHATEYPAGCDPGGRPPFIKYSLHPIRNRHRTHMARLSLEIDDRPMILALL